MASTQSSSKLESCDQDTAITSTSGQAVSRSTSGTENDQISPSSDAPSTSVQSAVQSPTSIIDQSNPSSDSPSTSGQSAIQSPPSCIEHDFSNPSSDSPSTSGQSAMQSSPSYIEHDFGHPSSDSPSTSRQVTRRAPPSSIEVDPNNPDGPPSKKIPICKRVRLQYPVWKEHIREFRWQICFAAALTVVSMVFWCFAYITNSKVAFLTSAFATMVICFTFVQLAIPEGPAIFTEIDGEPIKPSYLKTEKLRDSECYLTPSPEEYVQAFQMYHH